MRLEPFIIGEQCFPTLRAAELFIQRLRNSQLLMTPIPEPHHSFLCALIARHPNATEKAGIGIRHFTVEHAMHGTRCFYLTRHDGTKTDFSYFKCLERKD
jgi:hypothetical protein